MKRLLVAILGVALAASACGGDAGNVFSLTVGTCFDDPDSLDEIDDVPIVACGKGHDNEVYHLFDADGDDFPGESAIGDTAFEGCLAQFDGYVGLDWLESELDISFLTPTSESWDQVDDREVVCFLYRVDLGKMIGSMRGSGI